MTLTDNMKARILHSLRTKKISRVALAEYMGLGKSWATKLLKERDKGGLLTLSDEQVSSLEEFLKIKFLVITETSPVSGTAIKLSDLSKDNPQFEQLLSELVEFAQTCQEPMQPRYFEPKEMSKLGQEIIRLAFANEDKPGKVAREVLKLVSE